jgi:hypothetical protein
MNEDSRLRLWNGLITGNKYCSEKPLWKRGGGTIVLDCPEDTMKTLTEATNSIFGITTDGTFQTRKTAVDKGVNQ